MKSLTDAGALRTNSGEEGMVEDPICGMRVKDYTISTRYNERTYYFCSEGCKAKFDKNPGKFSGDYFYDLIIIGGGPAGLTAAVYASVLRIHTFLITKDIGGQAVDSTKIKNYMGFDFVTGPELVEKFRNQFLNRHYLEHIIDEVIKIKPEGDVFEILTKGKRSYKTRAIIIASGMKRRQLGVPGEERLLRKGVSHSSLNDGAMFAGKHVIVVGGGNSGIQTAKRLLESGCKVTVIEKANVSADPSEIEMLTKNPDFELLDKYDVVEIYGEDKVEGVKVQSIENLTKRKIICSGVFIQAGLIPNTEFCIDLLELNDKGEIKMRNDCSTSVEGIFACGDAAEGFGKRIIIASGEGAKAALRAKQYLTEKHKETARVGI